MSRCSCCWPRPGCGSRRRLHCTGAISISTRARRDCGSAGRSSRALSAPRSRATAPALSRWPTILPCGCASFDPQRKGRRPRFPRSQWAAAQTRQPQEPRSRASGHPCRGARDRSAHTAPHMRLAVDRAGRQSVAPTAMDGPPLRRLHARNLRAPHRRRVRWRTPTRRPRGLTGPTKRGEALPISRHESSNGEAV